MKTRLPVSFVLLFSCVWAQNDPPGRVARLNLASGAVSMLSQATGPDWIPAQINYPLTTGDQVWTDFDGRAELHIGTAAIRLREETSAMFSILDDRVAQLQLIAGGLNIRVRHLYPDEIFEVDTPNLAFTIRQPGHYRIDVTGQQTKVIVWSGAGEISGDNRTVPLRAGDFAVVTGFGQLGYSLINAPAPDDFDRWADARDRRYEQSESVRYVSQDTIGAEDLDLYGAWSEVPNFGPVWRPRVDVTWSPYRVGHWAWIPPFGWTWMDESPWGFAPFHYGRWAYLSGSWAWVPGRSREDIRYSPALVAWCGNATTSAWFPLGPGDGYRRVAAVGPSFVNRNAPGAVVGMSHTDMAAGRRAIAPVTPAGQVTLIAPVPVTRPMIQPPPRGGNSMPVARPPAAVLLPGKPVVRRHEVPGPVSSDSGTRRVSGHEIDTVRPTRPVERVEVPERPRQSAENPAVKTPTGRISEPRVERQAERTERPQPAPERVERPQPRIERPSLPIDRVERPTPAPERVERPQPRIERPSLPIDRVERPQPAPERVERPQPRIERPQPAPERVERPQPRIERPVDHPAIVTPAPRSESRREEPRRDDKKDDKKEDKKKP